LGKQVGTLALCHARTDSPMALVRAAAWANTMGRLGIYLPLFIVHDVGLILTSSRRGGVEIGPNEASLQAIGASAELRGLCQQYQTLLQMLAASEVAERAGSLRLRDDLIAVLLCRVLGDAYHRYAEPGKGIGWEPLPLDPGRYVEADVTARYREFDRRDLEGLLRFIGSQRLQIYTSLEQIDLDTLRLLGVFQGGASSLGQGALELGAPVGGDLLDLYNVFRSAEANDVVNFSLELLPSVLETKRAAGVQTFAVDGYASLERRGQLDALVLSEFAYDDDLFERKVIDDELYYYGHERQKEEQKRLQYILIDSSPSMRGVRQVFARGLALTMAKKFTLAGDEVWLRFFDSRLYDVQKVASGDLAAPYLLCFRSERGRNYGKVFRQLAQELRRHRGADRREIALYVITHGQCHIPVELVQQLRKDAYLYGIFILPSSNMRLDYLDLLHRSQVVDAGALASKKGRRDRALEIVADAGARAPWSGAREGAALVLRAGRGRHRRGAGVAVSPDLVVSRRRSLGDRRRPR
jgi:hypothetical protein